MSDDSQERPTFDQRGQNVGQQTNLAVDVYAGDLVYDVRGLDNPYLGLRPFTYADAARFAGREATVRHALRDLTTPGERPVLYFIVGASGCGKSSFAQAGLVPALEEHYKTKGYSPRHVVVEPGSYPANALAEALCEAGVPTSGPWSALASYSTCLPQSERPNDQLTILVIDQFEELFTQSDREQAHIVIQLLTDLLDAPPPMLLVIATLRIDYLPALFDHAALYALAADALPLRAMTEDELQDAIQRPLHDAYPIPSDDPGLARRFEPELVTALAEDAAQDATLLPLLQVTLEDIWRAGTLKRSAYTDLGDAISRRADSILDYTLTGAPRPSAERAAILHIFTDLVRIDLSTPDDSTRDVRRKRTIDEMVRSDPTRRPLINQLVDARLLAVGRESAPDASHIETVTIIHDALIKNWQQLQAVIAEERRILQMRTRFEEGLQEWLAAQRLNKYLLTHTRLEEAIELNELDDVALNKPEARTFVNASIDHRDHRRRQVLVLSGLIISALVVLLGIALQRNRVANRQTVEAEHQASIARTAEAQAADALVLSESARATAEAETLRADLNADEAQKQLAIAQSREVAAVANNRLAAGDPETAILFGVAAASRVADTPQVREVIRRGLEAWRQIGLLQGHSERVTGIAFSRDGTMMATASWDNTARVWDLETGSTIFEITDHTSDVTGAVFSLDSKYLITSSRDNTIRVWNIAGQRELYPPIVMSNPVRSVGVHPEGEWFGIRSENEIWLYDIETGESVARSPYASPEANLRVLSFSHDGGQIYAGADDQQVYIWDIETGNSATLSTEEGHESSITSVQQSTDRRFIASLSEDLLLLWEWNDEANRLDLRRLPQTGDGIQFSAQAEFSPDSRYLAAGSAGGLVRLWDLSKLESDPYQLIGHSAAITGIYFSPDGRLLATASRDGSVRIWNLRTREATEIASTLAGNESAPVFSRDGRLFATADQHGDVRLWRSWLGGNIGYFPTISYPTFSSVWQQPTLFLGGEDGVLEVWESDSGQSSFHKIGDASLTSLAVNPQPSSSTVAIGDANGGLNIYDLRTNTVVNTWMAHASEVGSLVFADQNNLVSAGAESDLFAWDLHTGRMLKRLRGHTGSITDVKNVPETASLVSTSRDGTARIWNLETAESKVLFEAGHPLLRLAVNPSGEQIAVGDIEGYVYIIDIASSHARQYSTDTVGQSLAYINDDYLAIGGEDGGIRLWDLSGDSTIVSYDGHGDHWVRDLQVTQDGRLLISTGDDGIVKVWLTLPQDVIQLACARTQRTISSQEWLEHFAFAIDPNVCEAQASTVASIIAKFPEPEIHSPDPYGSALPVLYYFDSQQGSRVALGSEIVLRWHAENATGVFLEHGEEREGVPGIGNKTITLDDDRSFTLSVENDAGTRSATIDIRTFEP